MKKFNYKNFDDYLNTQINRHQNTKYRTIDREITRISDVNRIISFFDNITEKSILCVGCRHISELKTFHSAGFKKVQGIDLLDPDIENIDAISMLKLDMHKALEYFGENSFDIIYSSHSLEHSYDAVKLLNDLLLISKEGIYLVLPKQNEPDEKDPFVFTFMNTDVDAWEDKISEELNHLLNVKINVSKVIFRNSCGADEISFFLKKM